MIAKIQDHVILLINLKYAERIDFLQQVEKLSKNKEDKDFVNTALHQHEQIFAIFRTGKLKAWYVPQKSEDSICLMRSYADPNLSSALKEKLEKEIRKELLSQCLWGKCKCVVWNDESDTLNRAPVYIAMVQGLLFGAVMGLVFGLCTKKTPVGLGVGLLWGVSMAYVFAASEMRKQQDILN